MRNFLNKVYFNNTIEDYLIVAGIILLSILVLAIIKRFAIKRLRDLAAKTTGTGDDFVVDSIDRFALPIIQFSAIYWGSNFLDLSTKAERIIEVASSVVITYF